MCACKADRSRYGNDEFNAAIRNEQGTKAKQAQTCGGPKHGQSPSVMLMPGS